MSLIQLIVVILVLGVVWALITKYVGLPPVVNTVITILFVVIVCIMLLQIFGINIGKGVNLSSLPYPTYLLS